VISLTEHFYRDAAARNSQQRMGNLKYSLLLPNSPDPASSERIKFSMKIKSSFSNCLFPTKKKMGIVLRKMANAHHIEFLLPLFTSSTVFEILVPGGIIALFSLPLNFFKQAFNHFVKLHLVAIVVAYFPIFFECRKVISTFNIIVIDN